MWNTAPLAAVVFTALCLTVTGAKQLDSAPDAVVYQYDGCHEEAMRKFIHSGLLKEELDSSVEFQRAWKTGCKHLISGGSAEHTAALFTYRSKMFSKTFNDAVATMGTNRSTYEHNFAFKSLHFLLMDALRLVKTNSCKNVYIISDDSFTATKGSNIRFGRFMQVNTDLELSEDMSKVYFNITTCFFYDLHNFCEEGEDIGLLSPSETFTVDDVRDVTDAEGYTHKEIILTHSKQQDSKDYCFSFSRSPADISTTWLVLLLVVSSLLIVNS